MPERSAPLEFKGVDAAECEAFISAVTAHAQAEGKQHDDQWIAEFASSCFAQAGLRWWNGLDEKDQGSWKLLRRAMVLRFQPQPTFAGESGEEAEAFVRMVRQKAFEAGKYSDDKWITAFVLTCLVGDAMRWHASLDPATRNDWNLLWPALLAQYTRDNQNGPQFPKARRRGRIQVRKKAEEGPICYLSKKLWNNSDQSGRVILTQAAIQALEVEYDPLLTKSQTLHIPDVSTQSLINFRVATFSRFSGTMKIQPGPTTGSRYAASTQTQELGLPEKFLPDRSRGIHGKCLPQRTAED
ncbi:hypothetical protein FS837_004019 [Tulasnella sp. UAMH 9824]|nr:hypothetical protein FS837_004019 [Tulasnella sp. UAMH 9824]